MNRQQINELLQALGQAMELNRTGALSPRPKKQRPATYLGRTGRSHRVRLPDGKVKQVAQRHVITRGALVVGGAVTLTDGMLDAIPSPYVQN